MLEQFSQQAASASYYGNYQRGLATVTVTEPRQPLSVVADVWRTVRPDAW